MKPVPHIAHIVRTQKAAKVMHLDAFFKQLHATATRWSTLYWECEKAIKPFYNLPSLREIESLD